MTKRDIDNAPLPRTFLTEEQAHSLATELLHDLWRNAQKRTRTRADATRRQEVNFNVAKSRSIIDEIDRVLAKHFGFTNEELDFIVNCDIKYRMSQEAGEEPNE